MNAQDNSILDLIRQRRSVRTYNRRVLSAEWIEKLNELMADVNKEGPFGNTIRYDLIILTEDEIKGLNKMIHYGFIEGSPAFIAGIMPVADRSLEDFGYLMEELILRAVGLGLDTCWLGGSLDKPFFLDRLGIRDGDALPAIFSVGFGAGRKRVFDEVIRLALRGNGRKSWKELFFRDSGSSPLDPVDCESYKLPLEMVRLAPSASNRQPWRVIMDAQSRGFHFLFLRHKAYTRFLKFRGKSDLQRLDMGIALAHFELTARELNLSGSWQQLRHVTPQGMSDCEYCVSWVMDDE